MVSKWKGKPKPVEFDSPELEVPAEFSVMLNGKAHSCPPHEHFDSHEAPEHGHPLPEHGHEHTHRDFGELSERIDQVHLGLQDQIALLLQTLNQHEHDKAPKHEHRDLRGHLQGAIRALLTVIETGSVNSEQRKAIHAVRVIIGDAHGSGCQHENSVYEENDILVCQDCRQTI